MKRGLALGLGLSIGATLFAARPAQAFEREWHLGGGLGVSAYPSYYTVGPALGLYGAYGISDVFDLRLELLDSYHGYSPAPGSASHWASPLSAAAGLAYKLDVLQWIPYGALLVGFQDVRGTLPRGEPIRRDDALAAVMVGLDYEMTRNFGLGAAVRADFLLSSPARGQAVTTLLRAEYHWGF